MVVGTKVNDTLNEIAKFIGRTDYIHKKWPNLTKNIYEIVMYMSSELFINGFSFEDSEYMHDFRIIAEYCRETGKLISDEELEKLSFIHNPFNTYVINKINGMVDDAVNKLRDENPKYMYADISTFNKIENCKTIAELLKWSYAAVCNFRNQVKG